MLNIRRKIFLPGFMPRFLTFAALFFADLAAKFCAELYMSETLWAEPAFLSLSLHRNTGISFSLLKNLPSASLMVPVLGAAALGLLCLKSSVLRSMRGTVFLWAGAMGNLAGRLMCGYVVDWLYVGIYINLADIWLCAGFLMILLRCAGMRKPEGSGTQE